MLENNETQHNAAIDDSAPGWDAVTGAFETLYPEQKKPMHYGTIVKWMLGGKDPLDGISIYDGGDYWHMVSYGMTELYSKQSDDPEWSGMGFEMTAKLKKASLDGMDEDEIKCMVGIMQSMGRYCYERNTIFQPEEYIYTRQEQGIDSRAISNITGFVTVLDEAGEIDTPHGKVQFVQLVGMTDAELKAIFEKRATVAELLGKLGHTLTDYKRESLL